MAQTVIKHWKYEAVVELIKVYKSQPCLYDTDSSYYNKRDKREEALQEMVTAVSKYHPGVTSKNGFMFFPSAETILCNFKEQDCNRKYQNLRSQFRKEYCKLETHDNYKSSLWWYNSLSFLKKFFDEQKIVYTKYNEDDEFEDHDYIKEVRMPKGMKVWDREAVYKLIEIYKNNPCLYDNKAAYYRDRNKIKKALNDMSAAVAKYHPKITNDDCKRKYQSLRAQFKRELSKMKEAEKSGWKFSSKLWCFDALTFLKESMTQPKYYYANQPKYYYGDQLGDDEEMEVEYILAVDSEVDEPEVIIPEPQKRVCLEPNAKSEVEIDRGPSPITNASVTSSLENYLQKKDDNVAQDKFKVFGEFVACSLRDMKHKKKRKKLEHDILRLIMSAEMESDSD